MTPELLFEYIVSGFTAVAVGLLVLAFIVGCFID